MLLAEHEIVVPVPKLQKGDAWGRHTAPSLRLPLQEPLLNLVAVPLRAWREGVPWCLARRVMLLLVAREGVCRDW